MAIRVRAECSGCGSWHILWITQAQLPKAWANAKMSEVGLSVVPTDQPCMNCRKGVAA